MSKELVESVKQDLEERGVNLEGPCGAFEITKRVAWALRNDGAGLHAKSSGNNCDGYSVDFIVLNKHAIDILVDAGGRNEPSWGDHGLVAEGAWREPVDPQDAPGRPPDAPGDDLDLEAILTLIAAKIIALEANQEALNADLNFISSELGDLQVKLAQPFKGRTSSSWGHSHAFEVKNG